MTWAARPEELGPPLGLVRKNAPREREGWHSTLEPLGTQVQVLGRDEYGGGANESPDVSNAISSRGSERNITQDCSDTRSWCHDLFRQKAKLATKALSVVAAVGLAGSAALTLPACTVTEVVNAAITACIGVIRALMNQPTDELPMGYTPCDQIVWPVNDQILKFCLYCDPTKPQELIVQFDCEGKFYPMRLRRIDNQPVLLPYGSIDQLNNEYLVIEKMTCADRFLIDAETTVAPFMSGLDCRLRSPNARVMPSIADYGTLDVRVANVPAPRHGDFEVESGAVIHLTGSFDEVAHYAMTCGICELSFKDGANEWTVFANPEVSAIAVFRNEQLHDARFLFAPEPMGASGG